MCIYLRNSTELTYKSQEHVISASLGGIRKLPLGVVSDQFNNYISGIERKVLKDSPISAARQIVGPGKRGKLGENHQTKGKVDVMIDHPKKNNHSLGYIKLGKPYLIPHVLYNIVTGAITISFNNDRKGSPQDKVDNFVQNCENIDPLRVKHVISDLVPDSIIMIGIEQGIESNFDAFVFKNDTTNIEVNHQLIKNIAQSILNSSLDSPKTSTSQVQAHQTIVWNEDFFRIYAKYCFNFLAFFKDENYVQQERFDSVRNFIAHGGTNTFAEILNEELEVPILSYTKPADAHIIMLKSYDKKLYGLCSLYNSGTIKVLLTDQLESDFKIEGLICDWRQREEKLFSEIINASTSRINESKIQ